MKFTALFVGATTVALALASPLDLTARGGSDTTTTTTVNSGCGNGNTQTNAFCCSGTTKTSSISGGLISVLDNLLGGLLSQADVLGTGCGSFIGNTCSNQIVCCNSNSGPVSGLIAIGINAGCLAPGLSL